MHLRKIPFWVLAQRFHLIHETQDRSTDLHQLIPQNHIIEQVVKRYNCKLKSFVSAHERTNNIEP